MVGSQYDATSRLSFHSHFHYYFLTYFALLFYFLRPITHDEDDYIKEWMEKPIQHALSHARNDVYIFFDEINTCNSMSLFKVPVVVSLLIILVVVIVAVVVVHFYYYYYYYTIVLLLTS
jgi:hypothetical protein